MLLLLGGFTRLKFGQQTAFPQNEQLLAARLELSPGVLGIQDGVAHNHFQGDALAIIVACAGSGRHDDALLGLLFSGFRQHQTSLRKQQAIRLHPVTTRIKVPADQHILPPQHGPQYVTIDAGLDTLDTQQSQKHSEGGVTGGLGGGLYDLAMDVHDSTEHASHTDDDRLKALYAAKIAYEVKDGVQAVQAISGVTDAQSAASATGINIQVGIGGSSASSKTTTHDSTSYGGHITSGGNVTIGATGGDLTIIGGNGSLYR